MPTRTKTPQPHRLARRPTPAPQGRFSRPGQTPRAGRPSRAGMPVMPSGRPSLPSRRRKPQPSTAQKALSALGGLLPGSGSSKRSRSAQKGKAGKRAGGMALLAGGIGLAMKNRDKLQGLIGGHSSDPERRHAEQHGPAATPYAPPAPPHSPAP